MGVILFNLNVLKLKISCLIGGIKFMRTIPFSPPDMSEAEINAVAEALRSGWITTGPRTKLLERRLAEYFHTEKVVCLSSGTAAEELILRALGIGEGDEVIVPAYTYTATASAAIHVGASIRLIDSQKDSLEMDYDQMEAAINEHTKAIIPVDLGGIVCDYDRIFQAVENKKHLYAASDNNIQKALGRVAVVSDCAHALGAQRHGVMAGNIGDFTFFSFHAVKNFTTAEGGCATWRSIEGVNNDELYYQFQLMSLHGQSKDALSKEAGNWEYDIIEPWYKCNMTDIMAAVGLAQLDRYEGMLARRREIIEKYDAACDELGVKHLVHFGEDFRSCGHLYIVNVPGIDSAIRNQIIRRMAEKGVACNVHYKPLPMMTAYKKLGYTINSFPNAYRHYLNEVTLPLHTRLTDEDVQYVIDSFREVIQTSDKL